MVEYAVVMCVLFSTVTEHEIESPGEKYSIVNILDQTSV